MPTLVLDIETVGEEYQSFDADTKDALTHWINRQTDDPDERKRLQAQVKDELGFSPLTGRVVALGVLDVEKDKGTVYFDPGESEAEETMEENYTLKPLPEADMLTSFWQGAQHYDTFVTFNGRGFDIPFLLVRSAVHGVKPTKNLMSNRYLGSQWAGAKHIDLLDQLSFYGAVRRPGNLHMWCRAFGIKSPKADGITGHDVAKLFRNGKSLDIARYNIGDLKATRDLFDRWQKFLSA